MDEWEYPEKITMSADQIDTLVLKMAKRIKNILDGEPRVFNFSVPNSEKVYYLQGYAKSITIHNSGPSDIVISFPNSAGRYYTIPSGAGNANPLTIPNISPGKVDKLILRSNGVTSTVEVLALMYNKEDTEWW